MQGHHHVDLDYPGSAYLIWVDIFASFQSVGEVGIDDILKGPIPIL